MNHQHDHIGCLKIEMMKRNKTFNDLSDIFKPQQFGNLIECIKKLLNLRIMWYDHPSAAQKLTTLVTKCAKKFRIECIRMESHELKASVKNFILLREEEVPTVINKKALEDQIIQKR